MKQVIYTAAKYLLLNYSPVPVLRFLKRVHYARKLRAFPPEKEPDVLVVNHLVLSGSSVVDIGANVGLYTKILSGLVGGQGRVYSIEPVPETFDILCSNIRKLRLGNVIPMKKAVSDTCGAAAMTIPRHLNRADNFYRAHLVQAAAGRDPVVNVETRTLDALFSREHECFSFVKCDVEGHELQCVRGARSFLERTEASWLMEISDDPDDPGSNAHELFREFTRNGYTAWWFDGRFLRERIEGVVHTNYFFLLASHVDALDRNAPHLLNRGS